MAPEQILGREVDARTDLFAFGALLYEMVTGKRAFDGENVARIRASILEGTPPSAAALESAPAAVGAIVRRCLARDPGERWQTAADVIGELTRVRESTGQSRPQSQGSGRWPP